MKRILEPEVMDSQEEAESYDAMGHGEVDLAFAERVVELGASEGRFLDVGAGPAQIPILLAQRCPQIRIEAVDLSEEMLKIARRRAAEAGVSDQIAFRRADAKDLPFPDNAFDGLISNSIVHHVHDAMKALLEMSRVAKPNALILIRDLIRPETTEEAQAFVEKYAADNTEFQRKMYYESFLAAFTVAEAEQMLERMNLEGASVVQSSDRHWSIERPANVQPGNRLRAVESTP